MWIKLKSFLGVLSSECLKMSKSWVWLAIFISPLLSALIGVLGEIPDGLDGYHSWLIIIGAMSMLHAMLFLPIMSGLFPAFICRYEHTGGGWKQLLVLPVSRTTVYVV